MLDPALEHEQRVKQVSLLPGDPAVFTHEINRVLGVLLLVECQAGQVSTTLDQLDVTVDES